jgi:hypothetical protein
MTKRHDAATTALRKQKRLEREAAGYGLKPGDAAARAWLEENLDHLPEHAPLRADSLDGKALHDKVDAESSEAVTKPPARVSKKDAPDFDEAVGLINDWDGAGAPPATKAQTEEWVRMATDLVRVLGPLSGYRGLLPLARLPERGVDFEVSATTIAALPALQALHRALLPGWRAIVRSWFERCAVYRIEARQRQLPARKAEAAGWLPPRSVPNGTALLETLRRNPPELMHGLPEGLTAAMLDHLAQHVTRGGGGRNGGYTPDTATAMAEKWATSPDAFEAELHRIAHRKHGRRERGNS